MASLPPREKARTSASRAAREKGADSKAAAAGSQCATTFAQTDATLHLIKGVMVFTPPAKELHWKDEVRADLVVAPKALGLIEQLNQEVDQAEGAGKVEADCLHLGDQMEPKITSDEGLDIKLLDLPKQYVARDESTTWRWDIVASGRGEQDLYLTVVAYVFPEHVFPKPEGGRSRWLQNPLFDDVIYVRATGGEVFTDFLADRWPLLVPMFLTVLTAIIIPLVVFWWKRRNQPSTPRDRASEPDDQRWI